MAQRTLRIALSTSLPSVPVNATIWLNDVIIEENLTVSQLLTNPLIVEHTIDDSVENLYIVKFQLNNDLYTPAEDLNLVINYLALSNANNAFESYTYLTNNINRNLRTSDNGHLLLGTVWSNFVPFEISFNTNNLLTWIDTYQYDIDNPQQDGSTII